MSQPASVAKKKPASGTVAIKWLKAFVIHFRGAANKTPVKPGTNLYTTEFLEEASKDPDFTAHVKAGNLIVIGGDAKAPTAKVSNSAPLSDDGIIEVIATLEDVDKLREIANDDKKSPRVREQADIRFKFLVAERERLAQEQEAEKTGNV